MNRFIFSIAILTIGLAMGLIMLVLYWLLYPYSQEQYIEWEYEKNPILNEGGIVKRGESVLWSVDVNILKNFDSTTTRYIQSDDSGCDFKIYQTTQMSLSVGQKHYVNSNLTIPFSMIPCRYYVHLVSEIKVNPIRLITVVRDTDYFIVQ
jgi:hypothetical protein